MLSNLFYLDTITQIVIMLVSFIAVVINAFARRYLNGDNTKERFSRISCLLCLSLITMLAADHIWLFFSCWVLSNYLLVKLMVHEPSWHASKNTGRLAARNFAMSSLFIGLGLLCFQVFTAETSIQNIILSALRIKPEYKDFSLLLIFVGVMAQSAIFPFHCWLLSSLNSPTPASAIMHAGLVNGGGLVLIRFAPLYAASPWLLSLIFIFGLVTAILATSWKLVQTNNKRMLASSTVAQMGFMIAQCGLGLFSAALCHLCWHGLFKAYLFLGSGSALAKKLPRSSRPKFSSLAIAVLLGVAGSYIFARSSGKIWIVDNTILVLNIVAFITSTQFALTVLSSRPLKNFISALLFTFVGAYIYGVSIALIVNLLAPLHIDEPQPLNLLHIIGVIALIGVWFVYTFRGYWRGYTIFTKLSVFLYMRAINASQPHYSTITAHHNDYRYK